MLWDIMYYKVLRLTCWCSVHMYTCIVRTYCCVPVHAISTRDGRIKAEEATSPAGDDSVVPSNSSWRLSDLSSRKWKVDIISKYVCTSMYSYIHIKVICTCNFQYVHILFTPNPGQNMDGSSFATWFAKEAGGSIPPRRCTYSSHAREDALLGHWLLSPTRGLPSLLSQKKKKLHQCPPTSGMYQASRRDPSDSFERSVSRPTLSCIRTGNTH